MTTMEERLKKIQDKGAQIIADENNEKLQRQRTIENYRKDIKRLAGRVDALITIARSLIQNRIPFGRQSLTMCGGLQDELVADGINHNIGFYFRYERGHKYFIGVGIKGGGCCGNDIAVDGDGDIVINIDPYYSSYRYDGYHDYCNKCKKFLQSFDEFEQRVNEYVDNL